jgi:hypothetical protein
MRTGWERPCGPKGLYQDANGGERSVSRHSCEGRKPEGCLGSFFERLANPFVVTPSGVSRDLAAGCLVLFRICDCWCGMLTLA